MNYFDIRKRIEYLMKYYNINNSDFSEMLHLSNDKLSRIKSGAVSPVNFLDNFASINININWLLYGKGQIFNSNDNPLIKVKKHSDIFYKDNIDFFNSITSIYSQINNTGLNLLLQYTEIESISYYTIHKLNENREKTYITLNIQSINNKYFKAYKEKNSIHCIHKEKLQLGNCLIEKDNQIKYNSFMQNSETQLNINEVSIMLFELKNIDNTTSIEF